MRAVTQSAAGDRRSDAHDELTAVHRYVVSGKYVHAKQDVIGAVAYWQLRGGDPLHFGESGDDWLAVRPGAVGIYRDVNVENELLSFHIRLACRADCSHAAADGAERLDHDGRYRCGRGSGINQSVANVQWVGRIREGDVNHHQDSVVHHLHIEGGHQSKAPTNPSEMGSAPMTCKEKLPSPYFSTPIWYASCSSL